jgi:hypothetical protein
MACYYRFRSPGLTSVLVGILLGAVMLGSVYAENNLRRTTIRPVRFDLCAELDGRECTLDIDPTALPMNTCDPLKTVNNFTLRFRGVDNDYVREESFWLYTLEWNGEPPELQRLAIGLGECIVRMDIIGACPAGYRVGIDPETGIYSIYWSSLPTIADLHISILVDGIYEVGQMPFAVNNLPETICGLICEETCDLGITCPPDVTLDCLDPTDPPFTGYPVIEGTCPPFDTSYVDTEIGGTCPYNYMLERMWTVTDASGLVRMCTQFITVVDTIPPTVVCGPDSQVACNEPVIFPEPQVWDNCDPDPIVRAISAVTPGPGPCEETYEMCWEAEDACGNVSESCCMTIVRIVDTEPPTLTCGENKRLECNEPVVFDPRVATDNCDPDPTIVLMISSIAIDPVTCEETNSRTWAAIDTCGNMSEFCSQTIVRVVDMDPPDLVCAPDEVVACEDPIVFTDPTVSDSCDADPVGTIVSTRVIPHCSDGNLAGECTEDWEAIHIRCWEAEDACGNTAECCQTIYVEPCEDEEMCSYTKGGWGSGCPQPQQDDMMSIQPGCMRDHYFDMVFPMGVEIGDFGGGAPYGVRWTCAAAVETYLPNGGTPGVLTEDHTDPTYTPAGNLAAQLLALTLNRGFSCAGVWDILGLTSSATCYGGFTIPASCGKFAGLTVDEFLAIANQAVGGNTAVLAPYGADVSDANDTADCLNNLYDECDPDYGLYIEEVLPQEVLGASPGREERTEPDVMLPKELKVSSHPNPLTKATTISYAMPVDGQVAVVVYDVQGRTVAALVDAHRTAGFHEVVWDSDKAIPGVYFCRVRIDNGPAVMEKLIKF